MTIDLKTRARFLALKLERERRERVRGSALVVAAGRSEDIGDVRELMNGSEVRDDSSHSGTVWVGRSFGIAPEGPQTILAHRQDEAYLIRDGRRRKATTYTDKPFPSGRARNKARRLVEGWKLVREHEALRGGFPEPMPEHGCLPSAPVDTLAHGRSACNQARWIARRERNYA